MKTLEKIFTVRANNGKFTDVCTKNDGEFYNNFVEFIRNNSKILNKSQIVEGTIQQNYYYDIENSSNYISLLGNETIKPPIKVFKEISTVPKTLGIQIKMSKYDFNFDNLDDKNQELILKNLLYKPFLKSVEKNIISGTYFDKSLFSTTNTITGTNDFNGLLKLVRELKDKQDNNIIVGNSTVISNIIDTINNKNPYLTEYLLNGTIEGIPIIGTVESPASENGNILVGTDPTNIMILMTPDLRVKKISVVGEINSYFQMFCFVNGGDVFENSIGLKI
jgi:hypothetical protein